MNSGGLQPTIRVKAVHNNETVVPDTKLTPPELLAMMNHRR
jgi:hypothetical protein